MTTRDSTTSRSPCARPAARPPTGTAVGTQCTAVDACTSGTRGQCRHPRHNANRDSAHRAQLPGASPLTVSRCSSRVACAVTAPACGLAQSNAATHKEPTGPHTCVPLTRRPRRCAQRIHVRAYVSPSALTDMWERADCEGASRLEASELHSGASPRPAVISSRLERVVPVSPARLGPLDGPVGAHLHRLPHGLVHDRASARADAAAAVGVVPAVPGCLCGGVEGGSRSRDCSGHVASQGLVAGRGRGQGRAARRGHERRGMVGQRATTSGPEGFRQDLRIGR